MANATTNFHAGNTNNDRPFQWACATKGDVYRTELDFNRVISTAFPTSDGEVFDINIEGLSGTTGFSNVDYYDGDLYALVSNSSDGINGGYIYKLDKFGNNTDFKIELPLSLINTPAFLVVQNNKIYVFDVFTNVYIYGLNGLFIETIDYSPIAGSWFAVSDVQGDGTGFYFLTTLTGELSYVPDDTFSSASFIMNAAIFLTVGFVVTPNNTILFAKSFFSASSKQFVEYDLSGTPTGLSFSGADYIANSIGYAMDVDVCSAKFFTEVSGYEGRIEVFNYDHTSTITDSDGNNIFASYNVGDYITFTGTQFNDGTYTILTKTSDNEITVEEPICSNETISAYVLDLSNALSESVKMVQTGLGTEYYKINTDGEEERISISIDTVITPGLCSTPSATNLYLGEGSVLLDADDSVVIENVKFIQDADGSIFYIDPDTGTLTAVDFTTQKIDIASGNAQCGCTEGLFSYERCYDTGSGVISLSGELTKDFSTQPSTETIISGLVIASTDPAITVGSNVTAVGGYTEVACSVSAPEIIEVPNGVLVPLGTTFTLPANVMSFVVSAQTGDFDISFDGGTTNTYTARQGVRGFGQGNDLILDNSDQIVITSNGDVDVIYEIKQ